MTQSEKQQITENLQIEQDQFRQQNLPKYCANEEAKHTKE